MIMILFIIIVEAEISIIKKVKVILSPRYLHRIIA